MGKRSWLTKQIQSEILPAIASLQDTPQDRAKVQHLTQSLRDGWAQRGFTELTQQKPLFDEVRGAIRQKLGAGHFSLDLLKLSRDEYFTINQLNQNQARNRQLHQQYLSNPDEIVAVAVGLLDSPEWADIAAGLAVLTGRRLNEVLKTAQFTIVSNWVVRFSGALKRGGEEVPLVFDIPTLTTAKRVVQATEKLRQITPPDANENRVAFASDRHFQEIVPAPHGKNNLYAHLWRSVYCCIATFWYCPKHVDDLLFKAHILGHFETLSNDEQHDGGKLRLRLENFASDRHYRLYEIDDSVIAQFNGQRKGVKLGHGGIQPLDAFLHGLPQHQPSPMKRKTPSTMRVWKEDHDAIASLLHHFPGKTQADKVSNWINWSLEQILKGNLSDNFDHQAHHPHDAIASHAHDLTHAEAHTTTPHPDPHIPHPTSSLESHPAPDTTSFSNSQVTEEPLPPAAATPLESKLDQLLDVMTAFVQGQINQQPQAGAKKQAIAQIPAVPSPQPLAQSPSEPTTPEKPRKYKTGETDALINQAIDAIIQFNDTPHRAHEMKWAITINGLKNFSLNQRAIQKIIEQRKDEIDNHHAKHQLTIRHNDRHKRRMKITDIINIPLLNQQ